MPGAKNTGMYVSAVRKIPKTDKLTLDAAEEELKKVNVEIAENFYRGVDNFSLWDKKRALLAVLRKD